MRTMTLLAFMPDAFLPLMLVAAGFALMFQMKKVATMLITLVGLMVFLPVILEPILTMLPLWALYLVMGIFILSIPVTVLSLVFGERFTRRHVWPRIGRSVFRTFGFVIAMPFRILGRFFRRRWII